MNALTRFLNSLKSVRRMNWVRAPGAAGWPVQVGVLACVVGLVMLGTAFTLHLHAKQLLETTAQLELASQRQSSREVVQPAQGEFSTAQFPLYEKRLDDVSLLFNLAMAQGVNIGPVDYRTEPTSSLPVVVRLLDLRLNGDYPKLKAFVAELLKEMPHGYLREIQVDQTNGAVASVQVTLKLAFVYRTATASRL